MVLHPMAREDGIDVEDSVDVGVSMTREL